MGGEGGVNRQHPRKSYERADGHEIAQGLVRQLLVKPRIDNERGVRRGRNRVAIRIGLHQRLQANGSVRAGAVLDKYLLPQSLRELFCREPADEVGPSACRVWNDHPDRLLRPGLRGRNCGRNQKSGKHRRDPAWNLSHRLSSPYYCRCSPQWPGPDPFTAAAMASPICVVLASPPRSRVRCLPSAITRATAASMPRAAADAVGSLCLRPSQASSIWPDMIMA